MSALFLRRSVLAIKVSVRERVFATVTSPTAAESKGWSYEALLNHAQSGQHKHVEAMAAELGLSPLECTTAWQVLPSCVLGPCPLSTREMSPNGYAAALAAFGEIGGLAQPALANLSLLEQGKIGKCSGKSVSVHWNEQHVERVQRPELIALEQAARAEYVEHLVNPSDWARMASMSPSRKMAVHVAQLSDTAWRKWPSKLFGHRPSWLQAHTHVPTGWTYSHLVLLASRLGWARIIHAVEQPSLLCADAVLADKLWVLKARENVERLLPDWVQRIDLLHSQNRSSHNDKSPYMNEKKPKKNDKSPSLENLGGVQVAVSAPPDDSVLLRLQVNSNHGLVAILPSTLRDHDDVALPHVSSVVTNILQPWLKIAGERLVTARDLFDLERDPTFEVWREHSHLVKRRFQLDATMHQCLGLADAEVKCPPAPPGYFPSPMDLRRMGYRLRFACLFEEADDQVKTHLYQIAEQQVHQLHMRQVCRHLLKWFRHWNCREHLRRIDEIEAFFLDMQDNSEEVQAAMISGPKALLQRCREHEMTKTVKFEKFPWLLSAQDTLATTTCGKRVVLLKDSHEVVKAASRMSNCARNRVRAIQSKGLMLLVLVSGDRPRMEYHAMAEFKGAKAGWGQIYGPCNKTVPTLHCHFTNLTSTLQLLWDEAVKKELRSAISGGDRKVLNAAIDLANRTTRLHENGDMLYKLAEERVPSDADRFREKIRQLSAHGDYPQNSGWKDMGQLTSVWDEKRSGKLKAAVRAKAQMLGVRIQLDRGVRLLE